MCIVILSTQSFLYHAARLEIKYLRADHKEKETAWDSERTDLLNRIAAKSVGEYERLKNIGHMPRDEPQPLTAHEKAMKKWHNAGKQGGIAN